MGTPTHIAERVAQADIHLKAAALPSYLEIAAALAALVLDPRLEGYHSTAYDEAERVVGELRPLGLPW